MNESISMAETDTGIEITIARARIGLALAALLSIYIDPTNNGWFDIDSYALTVLCGYLLYSVAGYLTVKQRPARLPDWYLSLTALLDVLFAACVALATEGHTSPSSLFFVFAILAVNLRTGFRAGALITLCCSAVYLALLLISAPGREFVMRAVYLAIVGYLICFFGKENMRLNRAVRELENRHQREQIARTLHDGYIQALASVNLQLATCHGLLKGGRPSDALGLIQDIRGGVQREYDEVRAYVRSLGNVTSPMNQSRDSSDADTVFDVKAQFRGRGSIPEQILLIIVEAMRNTLQHAAADHSTISVTQDEGKIHIAIDDDGLGIPLAQNTPWTIASRVDEYGGNLQIARDLENGTHIKIELAE